MSTTIENFRQRLSRSSHQKLASPVENVPLNSSRIKLSKLNPLSYCFSRDRWLSTSVSVVGSLGISLAVLFSGRLMANQTKCPTKPEMQEMFRKDYPKSKLVIAIEKNFAVDLVAHNTDENKRAVQARIDVLKDNPDGQIQVYTFPNFSSQDDGSVYYSEFTKTCRVRLMVH